MKERCYNPSHDSYKYYGAKGIGVCERWMNFEGFYSGMLPTYKNGLTLDRLRNKEDYSPENCRWATIKEQNRNRTANIWIEYEGKKMILSEWAAFYKIDPEFINRRLKTGMSMTEIVKVIESGMTGKDHNKGMKYKILQDFRTVKCAYCQAEVVKKRKAQKFCSPLHKKKYYKTLRTVS